MIPRFCYQYSLSDLFAALLKINSRNFSNTVLSSYFQERDIYYTNYARTGLRLILTSLNLKPGARIGIQAYTCHTVFQAIAKAGFIPCFVDIGDHYSIDCVDLAKKMDRMDALIVCHTFGIPADMDEIKQISGNKPIIEDCAHALFSKYKGKPVGTLGDAAIFSFGHGKYPSIGKGGFTVIHDKELSRQFAGYLDQLPVPGVYFEIKNVLINYIWAFAYRSLIYDFFTFPVAKKWDKKVDFLDKFSFDELKGYAVNVAVLNRKFAYYQKMHQRQCENGHYLVDHLNNMIPCQTDTAEKVLNYYLFPLRSAKRDEIVTELLRMGVEAGKHFHQSLDWAGEFGYRSGDCPNTERIINEIYTIPSYYKLNHNQLDLIIQSIQKLAI